MVDHLVIVGDALLDGDEVGVVERLAPDLAVPVLDATRCTYRPGGAALCALLARRLAARATLVTALGRDEAGDRLRHLLTRAGVDIVDLGLKGATPQKLRLRCASHPLLRLDRGGRPLPLDPLSPVQEHGLDRLLASAAAVIVSDYGRGVAAQPQVRALLEARDDRIPLVWDPHPSGPQPAGRPWVVCPNEHEALRLAGHGPASEAGPTLRLSQLSAAAGVLRDTWSARAVAVTRGAAGALLVGPVGPPAVIPCSSLAGIDPCGAGDQFASALAAALGGRATLGDAVEHAVSAATDFLAAGGVATVLDGNPGGTIAAEQRTGERPAASEPIPPSRSPSNIADALQRISAVKRAGGTVVASGGCFDLLHPGHVRLLRAARDLGDLLVVLLNSDASVRRLKGERRPIQRAEDRAAVLAAIDAVDLVVTFDDDTPIALLDRLRPDIFAKGGDYAAAELAETPVLARWGGQVVVLPYSSGYSTTRLVDLLSAPTA